MYKPISYLIFFLSFFLYSLFFGQEIQTKSYTISDGLVQNQINTITQDRHGRMWFGTVEGLSVYDGNIFKSFTIFNSPITSNYILSSFFDKENGTLWFGTLDNGFFSIKEDSVINTFPATVEDKWRRINEICKFGSKLLLGSNNGLVIIIPGQNKPNHFKFKDTDNRINAIAILDSNNIAFGTLSGIFVTDSAFNIKYRINRSSGLNNTFIHDLLALNSHQLIAATRNGVADIRIGKKIEIDNFFDEKVLPHPFVNVLYKSRSGTIWMGSGQGLLQYESGHLKHYRIKDYFYKSIFQDREGNLWFGARGAGVLKLRDEMFINYTLDDGLPNQEILTIFPDKNGLTWYGTNKGIFTIKNDQIKSYLISSGTFKNVVTDIIRYHDKIFITSWDGFYLKEGNQFRRIFPDPKSSRYHRLNRMAIFNDTLWVTDDQNIFTWRNGHFEKKDHFFPYNISDIKTGPRGNNLLITGENKCISSNLLGKRKEYTLPQNYSVRSIIPIDEKSFYIGTNQGLILIDGDSAITDFPGASKLKFYEILAGVVGPKDNRWLGTNTGLLKFNHHGVKRYAAYSGIVADEIITNRSFAKDAEGNIHIGTFVGVSICRPSYELVNTIAPEIMINKIDSYDRKISIEDKEIELPYNYNTITIYFTGISFRDENQLTYQYRLFGLDSTWSKPAKMNSIKFIKLPYEHFRFEVRAINGDHLVSPNPASFEFTILPPVYLRWWFLTLFAICFTLLGFYLYRRRLQHIKNENIQLDLLVKQRTIELRSEKEKLDERTKELSLILSQLQNTQDQLIQSEKMASLGRLIKGIIEEVNNPLTYIFTNTYHLSQYISQLKTFVAEVEQSKSASSVKDIMEKNEIGYILEDLAQITSGFDTTLSRVIGILENLTQYGTGQWTDEDVDIVGVLDSVIYLIQKQFPEVGLEKTGKWKKVPALTGSEQQIQQAFRAILQNAAEATNGIGIIVVDLNFSKTEIIIKCTDNGQGIKEEIAESIFDPFFTASNDSKKIGLGLSIALSIIVRHNGQIDLNRQYRHGAEFIIKLPLSETSPSNG